jgi:2-polyprenyl-3-methyl-5-hydroxy-6-metoxy-1,4-benzoquinol methylase
MHPLPRMEEVSALYTQECFCGKKGGHGYTDYERDKEPMKATFKGYLDLIETYAPLHTQNTLLDIGTSTGAFLHIAREKGWDAKGIEISDYAAQKGREAGLTIHTGTIEDCPFEDGLFSAITGFDVFEHLLEHDTALTKIYNLLKPGGILCINTPTSDSLWARFWGKNWQAILPPEHTMLFNEKTLRLVLSRHNFHVEKVTKVAKTFTLPYIFHMMHLWQGKKIFQTLSNVTKKGALQKITLPLNVRDNMFVIARKP